MFGLFRRPADVPADEPAQKTPFVPEFFEIGDYVFRTAGLASLKVEGSVVRLTFRVGAAIDVTFEDEYDARDAFDLVSAALCVS